jgi:transcriptional regulator with XRE-family HTH domain
MEKKYIDIGNRLMILRGKKTQTEFAIDIGTTLRTYQHYESGGRRPNPDTLKIISDKYHKSIEWILSGKDKESYSQSLAEPPRFSVADIPLGYENHKNGIDPYIQAISDVKEIFDSGDPILIPAIQANLHAFKRALLRERQFEQILKENEELKVRLFNLETICVDIPDLKSQFEILQSENRTLQTENKTLRDLNGGCAPINLKPDNAALTGTDDKKT